MEPEKSVAPTSADIPDVPRPETTPSTEASAPATKTESKEPPKMLDLVFCMDCTGSMGSYIQSAKQNIETIVQKLIAYEKCDLRFGLVAYRDHPPQDSTFITQVYPFVTSLRRMKENLDQLSANGGGDGPEAVATGLYDSLHMPWRKDATKVVILISDAPPHGLGESGDGFPGGEPNGHDPIAIAHEMAREGITVYSVGCEPAIQSYRFARAFLCSVAEITSGQAIALSNSQLLADVILGGAVEELGLARLMEQVQQEMHAYTADLDARGVSYAEDDVANHVTNVMKAKGMRTKQMKTNVHMSDDRARHMNVAKSLGEARSALEAAAPASGYINAPVGESRAASSPSFLGRISRMLSLRSTGERKESMERRFSDAEDESCDAPADLAAYAPAPMAPRPMTEEVALDEDDISYDQVARMVHKVNVRHG